MRNFILGLLLLVLGTSLIANGQSTSKIENKISIDVSARVINSVELITIQSMRLSQANVANNRITINPQSSSNAGKMVASGSPNSEVRISYISQRELILTDNPMSLEFNYRIAINNQDDQASAELLEQENRNFEFNDEGKLYIWIGGAVNIKNASPGQYKGEFTLDIEYI